MVEHFSGSFSQVAYSSRLTGRWHAPLEENDLVEFVLILVGVVGGR